MKKITYSMIIFAFLLQSSITYGKDEWTKIDSAYQALFLILDSADWLQTREIARNPKYYEQYNPILGKHPSVEQVDLYFATMAVFHTLISYHLPTNLRRKFQLLSIGVEAGCIIHNFNIGIDIKF